MCMIHSALHQESKLPVCFDNGAQPYHHQQGFIEVLSLRSNFDLRIEIL